MVKDYTPGARLCSSTAAAELMGTTFLHNIAALTGFKEMIDTKVTTDHYGALDQKKKEMSAKIEGMRWTAIQVIMDAQTSRKLMEENEVFDKISKEKTDGVDQASMTLLKDFVFFLDTQKELNEKSIQDKINLFNFSAIVNTIFLYMICFVLLVFVKWN